MHIHTYTYVYIDVYIREAASLGTTPGEPARGIARSDTSISIYISPYVSISITISISIYLSTIAPKQRESKGLGSSFSRKETRGTWQRSSTVRYIDVYLYIYLYISLSLSLSLSI